MPQPWLPVSLVKEVSVLSKPDPFYGPMLVPGPLSDPLKKVNPKIERKPFT